MIREIKYAKLINDYEQDFKNNEYNIDEINRKMTELYKKTKKIAYHYTKKGIITNEFAFFAKMLLQLEKNLPLHFILENEPIF